MSQFSMTILAVAGSVLSDNQHIAFCEVMRGDDLAPFLFLHGNLPTSY
jgi:hypothetical protein